MFRKIPALFMHSIANRFIRFLLIGLVNTGFSYAVYALLVKLGFHYAIANLIALIIGILFGFHTQSRYVFASNNNKLFSRYLVAWITIYLLNISIISLFIYYGFSAYLSGALALPFSVLASYILQKYYVFKIKTRVLQEYN